MKLSVIAVGKMSDRRLAGLSDDYRRRLAHHLSVEDREVKKARSRDANKAMSEEGERLLEATPQGALTVAMTEEGKELSSVEVAKQLNQWMIGGRRKVAFYVGGAHGLSREVKKSADRRWSLSAMTFPHDVARMLLWEQLYRAMTIIRGEPYHK